MTPIRLRRGMISVSGTKAREFLQGLVSCDMRKAQPQKDLLVGLLLNAQGRILFDFLLYQQTLYQQALYQQAAPQQHESKTEDHFVIDCAEEDVFPLGRHLRRFVLGSGLRLGIVADKSVFALSVKDSSGASGKDTSGKDALENDDSIPHALRASLGASLEASLKNVPHSLFRDPRHKDMGWRLYMSEKALSEKKLLEISENEQAYTLQRLKCGIPEGRDEIPSHSALPAVYGFDRMHALSYEKGCYVGQEVVARMHYRGAPKRALAAASCPDLSFLPERRRDSRRRTPRRRSQSPLPRSVARRAAIAHSREICPRRTRALPRISCPIRIALCRKTTHRTSLADAMRLKTLASGFVFGVWLAAAGGAGAQNNFPDALKMSEIYKLSAFASVPGARSLAVAPEIQTVFVGTRGKRVFAVHKNKVWILSDTLRVPNGIAWKSPWLYVAEQNRIRRFRFEQFTERLPPGESVLSSLPNKRHHGWRYIGFDNAGTLFVSVGVACNICKAPEPEGTLLRVRNEKAEIFARGIRNSVGFDFHPATNLLWFTDNGADFMGDDRPAEELNLVRSAGAHYGFPWFGGGSDRTRQFENESPPLNIQAPVLTFPAHTAPLGIHFYRHERISSLVGKALIALHGSWNRTEPVGYSVLEVDFSPQTHEATGWSVLIDGFLSLSDGPGRPVDIKTHWDGSVLISDDRRGAIYRLEQRTDE